jgi:hypothetical protein
MEVKTLSNTEFIIHFLSVLNDQDMNSVPNELGRIRKLYMLALKKAKKYGGRKSSNKSFAGGIKFKLYGGEDQLNEIVNEMLIETREVK